MIDAVIFDIGGVLIQWDPANLYRKVVANSAVLADILDNVITLEWHTAHDAGLPIAEGVRQRTAEFPHYADLIALFESHWDENLGPVDDAVIDLLRQLDLKGMPLYALTNFSVENYPRFAANHDFMNLFHDVVVSGEVGLIKPDPRIFRLAIARFAVVPERTLFIDDRSDNVAAAAALGFQIHHFQGAQGLAAALTSARAL